jgi:hypothetical protein
MKIATIAKLEDVSYMPSILFCGTQTITRPSAFISDINEKNIKHPESVLIVLYNLPFLLYCQKKGVQILKE